MAFAICWMIIVLPALGGETMRPRWPLPTGATRSMTRGVYAFAEVSMRSCSEGYSGVSLPNSRRDLASSGAMPLTESTRTSALYFWRWRSPSRGSRTAPATASPARSPHRRTLPRVT